MTITEFIDDILYEIGEELDNTGNFTRTDVLNSINAIQKEISSECECIFKISSETSITSDTEFISISNFMRGISAYRGYDSIITKIDFYNEQQIAEYDSQWKTRTGEFIRGLIVDNNESVGNLRIYPIPNNNLNSLIIHYIKFADKVSSEFTVAGDASGQLSNWLLYGIDNNNISADYKLYWELSNSVTTRNVKLYKSSNKTASTLVAEGSLNGDGIITLSERNDSNITGTVTVAYTINDTDSSNVITFSTIELNDLDITCLNYGVKAYLFSLERDGKSIEKAKYWRMLYGGRNQEGLLTGELQSVKRRSLKHRLPSYIVQQEYSFEDTLRTRPLYPWEV